MSARFWLAIDTAADVASVAVGSPGRAASAATTRGARQHAAQIVPLIAQVLAHAGVTPEQLAGLIVADGPGSFTGLRIGWAAAKGLAHERGLPLVAIPSLAGVAHAAARGTAGPVAACFDALRGQLFGSMYAFGHERVEVIVPPALVTLQALIRIAPVRPVLAVGDGAQRHGDEIMSWTGRLPVGLESLPPVAASLLELSSFQELCRPVEDLASAEPLYGRPAEAQVKWEAHYGRPLPHSSR